MAHFAVCLALSPLLTVVVTAGLKVVLAIEKR